MQLLSDPVTDRWKSLNTFSTNCTPNWNIPLALPRCCARAEDQPFTTLSGSNGRYGKGSCRLPVLGKSFCLCRELDYQSCPIDSRHTFAHRLPKTGTKAKDVRSITFLQCYEKSVASFKSSPAAHSSTTLLLLCMNYKCEAADAQHKSTLWARSIYRPF